MISAFSLFKKEFFKIKFVIYTDVILSLIYFKSLNINVLYNLYI